MKTLVAIKRGNVPSGRAARAADNFANGLPGSASASTQMGHGKAPNV